jgi:uncharacterized membrane protein YkoI
MRRRLLAVAGTAVVLVAAGAWGYAALTYEDDHPVDPGTPQAQRAIAAAREVVPGRVLDVLRDEDNGKWEVIISQDGREYEVELDPATFGLLRLDYD